MAEIKFGQYAPDVASVGTSFTNYVKNVYPQVADGYGPLRGPLDFSLAMTGTPQGLFGAVKTDGTSSLFAGSGTKLYNLNGVTRAWEDVTRTVGGDYSVASSTLWDFCQFGNIVIAVADGNAPQYFTLGSSTDFAVLAGSPPQARRVAIVGDHVVLSGLTSTPNRIHWSAINDTTGWTAGTALSDYQDFPDGGAVQGVAGGEFGIVFQERAIRRMIGVGPPTIFQFQRISSDRGALMRYGFCQAAGNIFFLANDGFYRIDPGGGITDIGSNRVNKKIFDEIDPTQQNFVQAVSDPASARVFWFYRSTDNAQPYMDRVLIYDWSIDRWSYAEIEAYVVSTSIPLSATLEGLDAVGTLDALPFSLDEYTATVTREITMICPTKEACNLTGDYLEAEIDTPEGSIGDGIRSFTRSIAPITDAAGAYVSTLSRARLIDAKTQGTETAIGVRGYASLRTNNRFVTARVRIPAAETWTYARGVDLVTQKSSFR